MKPNRLIILSFLTMLTLLAPVPVSGASLSAPVSPDMVCSIDLADKMNPWSALNANSIGEMSDDGGVTESHTTMSATNDFSRWSLLNAHSIGETSDDGFFAIAPSPDSLTANQTDWSELNADSIGEMSDGNSVVNASIDADSRASEDACGVATHGNSSAILSGKPAVQGTPTLFIALGRVNA